VTAPWLAMCTHVPRAALDHAPLVQGGAALEGRHAVAPDVGDARGDPVMVPSCADYVADAVRRFFRG
jgi:hypothetical protein